MKAKGRIFGSIIHDCVFYRERYVSQNVFPPHTKLNFFKRQKLHSLSLENAVHQCFPVIDAPEQEAYHQRVYSDVEVKQMNIQMNAFHKESFRQIRMHERVREGEREKEREM